MRRVRGDSPGLLLWLRRWAVLLICLPLLLQAAHAQGNPDDPVRFVQGVGDATAAILGDSSLAPKERIDALRSLMDESFDLPIMGRFVLGRHWRRATDAERAEYLRLFESFLVTTYGARVPLYNGEMLRAESARETGERSVTVIGRVLRSQGEAIGMNFRLREVRGAWRIFDVSVEGVSLAQTHRNEFDSLIQRSGGNIAGLLDRLREITLRHGGASS